MAKAIAEVRMAMPYRIILSRNFDFCGIASPRALTRMPGQFF
jgi:hypothetical protein